jgi:hypothetical protein
MFSAFASPEGRQNVAPLRFRQDSSGSARKAVDWCEVRDAVAASFGQSVIGSAAKDERLRISAPLPSLAFELGNVAFGLRIPETKITNEAPSVWDL